MTRRLGGDLETYYGQFGRDHHRQRVRLLDALAESRPPRDSYRRRRWTAARLAAAALCLIVLAWLVSRLDRGPASIDGSEPEREWWRGSAFAWAEEADAALRDVAGDYVTWREETLRLADDGSRQETGNEARVYSSNSAYRRDSYYLKKRTGIQWYTQEGENVVLTGLRLERKTYSVVRYPDRLDWDTSSRKDPRSWIREIRRVENSTSEELGRRRFEGRECVGFRLTWADDSGPSQTSIFWFDVQSKLPVQVEFFFGRILVLNHFRFEADLPPEIFTPRIPDHFTEAIAE